MKLLWNNYVVSIIYLTHHMLSDYHVWIASSSHEIDMVIETFCIVLLHRFTGFVWIFKERKKRWSPKEKNKFDDS